jgi:hypothetical protein
VNQRESDLEYQITRLYGKLKGYSQVDARLSYLDYVSAWKIYGSTFFHVESVNRRMPSSVVLAINRKAIIIIDPETKEFISILDYTSNLFSWASTPTSFVLVTGSEFEHQEKLFFRTEDGAQMLDLIENYTRSSSYNKELVYNYTAVDLGEGEGSGDVASLAHEAEQSIPFA